MFRRSPLPALAALVLASTTVAFEYHNPVRAGDFPDPSVIRVGGDYWATATSSEWAPHFPLLHSRDLVNWEQVGSVFAEQPTWAKSNFWAPEISEHEGRFFVYYVARDKDTNRLAVAVATANHPDGPYTDHGPLVSEEAGSIDPVPFTDADGRRWLFWKNDGNSMKRPTPIWVQRLSDDGLKLVGDRHEVIRNDAPWEGAVVEGPFVLRHGEFLYLFYSGGACCGRNCDYALGVARARSVLGPWEKAPRNPLSATNAAWRCPGHGSIVTDPDGRNWLLYHSYSQNGFVATGRQMILDEVVFGPDGWPTINGGHGPSTAAIAPAAAASQQRLAPFRDAFDGPDALAPGWQWLIGRRPQAKVAQGFLTLVAGEQNTAIVRSVPTASFVAETEVDGGALSDGVFAGLAAYGDRANEIALVTDGRRVQIWSWRGRLRTSIAEIGASGSGALALRLACVGGNRFRFAVREPAGGWREIGGETDGSHLPPWDRGLRAGLTVHGPVKSEAKFDYFVLTPDETALLAR